MTTAKMASRKKNLGWIRRWYFFFFFRLFFEPPEDEPYDPPEVEPYPRPAPDAFRLEPEEPPDGYERAGAEELRVEPDGARLPEEARP